MDLGNPRIMTSTEALDIEDIPNELLVVGGGYIGMELGSVYASLGSKVSVVEALPEILAGADSDLVKVFQKYVSKKMDEMMLSHKVKKMATKGKKIEVEMKTLTIRPLKSNTTKYWLVLAVYQIQMIWHWITRIFNWTIVVASKLMTSVKQLFLIFTPLVMWLVVFSWHIKPLKKRKLQPKLF